MNLQDVRESFESRVASIEKETSDLLGKLALVNEAQNIAAEIGGESPVVSEGRSEPTGSFSQTVTALPDSETHAESRVEASAIEAAEETGSDSVSNVAPFAPAAAEDVAAEVTVAEVGAEAEVEAQTDEAEQSEPELEAAAALEPDAVAEDEGDTEAVTDTEAVAATEPQEETSHDVRVDQVLAEFEQEAMAQTAAQPAFEAEEVRAESVFEDPDADADPTASTAELEKLADPEAAEIEADAQTAEADLAEAEAAEPEEQPDALASLREKLASAAAEEPPKSPFLTLGKFLNRAK